MAALDRLIPMVEIIRATTRTGHCDVIVLGNKAHCAFFDKIHLANPHP